MDDLFKKLGLDDKPQNVPREVDTARRFRQQADKAAEAGFTGDVMASDTALELDEWDVSKGEELSRRHEFYPLNLPPTAVADFFAAAFTHDPQLAHHCTDARRHEFVKNLLESPEYGPLHKSTTHNLLASEAAAKKFADQFAELVKQDKTRKKTGNPRKDSARDRMAAVRFAGKALAEAGEEVEELEEVMSAMGCGRGQPDDGKLDVKQVASLFKRVRDHHMLRTIMDLAGRYRVAAQARQRQKVIHGQDEVVGIELGGDVGKLIPSELALLADDDYELDAARRLLERQSMQRETRGTEKLGKGPVVVCVDESGSMTGNPVAHAKAFALSMAWVARHQKRWIALVGYSGGRTGTLCAMPPGKWDQNALLEWLGHFYGGGTVLDVPLHELPKVYWPQLIARGMPRGKTDVILVTDGIVDLPHQMKVDFLEWKKQEQARCITLVIGCPPGPLEQVSDEVFRMGCVGLDEAGVSHAMSI